MRKLSSRAALAQRHHLRRKRFHCMAPVKQHLGPLAFLLGLSALLAGCGTNPAQLAHSIPTTGQALQGHLHGGQQPISGAHVYLFASSTSGYGAPSLSLIQPGSPGVFTDQVGSYVLTDASGSFALGSVFTCTQDQQLYLLALGGNPGLAPGTDNPALALMAPVGPCPGLSNAPQPEPYIFINEVSTVATAYALAGYMADATHLASSGTTLAKTGLANAFSAIPNLEDISTGLARSHSLAGNGMSPQATLNTLADLIAPCINSTGSTAACATLFANAKSLTGTIPADTVTAALNIAHAPAATVPALFALVGSTPPFLPALATAPNDWTLGITFYSDTLVGPYYPAIDALGNVWTPGFVSNNLNVLDPFGVPLSGYSGFTGAGLNQPIYAAIDSAQNVWVANFALSGTASLSRFSNSGTVIGAYPSGPNCASVAIDTSQNVWVDCSTQIYTLHNDGSAFSQIDQQASNSGISIDSAGGVWTIGQGAKLDHFTLPAAFNQFAQSVSPASGSDLNLVAVDAAGNIWFASGKNSTLGKYSSSGQPISPATGFTGGGLNSPAQLAIDGSNRVWIANRAANTISAFNNDGTAITPTTGYQPSGQVAPDPTVPPTAVGLSSPHGLAIDGSGNLWVTNFTGNSLTEIIGVATPAVTPITPTTHGQRP